MIPEEEQAFLVHVAQRLGRSKPLTVAPHRSAVGVAGLIHSDMSVASTSLADEFIANWTSLTGVADVIDQRDVPDLVRKLLKEHDVERVVGWDVPELVAYGVPAAVTSTGATYTAWSNRTDMIPIAEQATLGITTCDFAVAETGTLALLCDRFKGRAVSLLPPVYLALIPVDRLVPRMTDVLEAVTAQAMPSSLNFVTGPSRTGDIEMVLTVGVHGPGNVYAYIVT